MSLNKPPNAAGSRTGQHGVLLLAVILGSSLAMGVTWGASRLDTVTRQHATQQLDGVTRLTRLSLEAWFENHVADAELIADAPVVRELVTEMGAAAAPALAHGTHPAQSRFIDYVRPAVERRGYLDCFVVGPDGIVLASLQADRAGAPMPGAEMHRDRFAEALSGRVQFIPQVPVDSANPHALGVSVPVRSSTETIIGLLVLQIDSRAQFTRLTHAGRFGNSVEVYAFDPQGRLLTDTRFDQGLRQVGLIDGRGQGSVFLKMRDPGLDLLKNPSVSSRAEAWPLTTMATQAVRKGDGRDSSGYRNLLGQRVVGAWTYSQQLGIGVGAELDEAEALAAYRALKLALVAVSGLTACLMLALAGAFWLHRARMRRVIAAADAKLEERVAERTRDLANANGRLALEVSERRSSESRLRAVQAMLEETTEKYARLSQIDPLTELANRRRFDEFLEREWRRCIRNRSQMSLLILDFDYFKLFNDTYGHAAGDECLRAIAEVLSAAARRPGDLAARIGGEEFAVVLCDTGAEGALRVARQTHAWIEDLAIEHDTTQVVGVDNVTVSIGVASTQPELTSNPSVLVYHADEALYAAKQNGRNCIRAYESAPDERVDHDETFTRTKSIRSHELMRRTER